MYIPKVLTAAVIGTYTVSYFSSKITELVHTFNNRFRIILKENVFAMI